MKRTSLPLLRRRDFITLLGGAVAWPLAVRAQQPDRMRRIGVLMGFAESDREGQANVAAFREGLQKIGSAQSRKIQMTTRWATPGDAEARRRFAKELVASQPDLIISHGTPNTATLLQQTRTIPIVFVNVSDPVGSGFVASFPQPGGNVTGFITMEPTMASKWLELLKEIAPRVARSALLFNPATAPYAEYYLNSFKAAAASFAVEAIAAPVRDTSELEVQPSHHRLGNRERPPRQAVGGYNAAPWRARWGDSLRGGQGQGQGRKGAGRCRKNWHRNWHRTDQHRLGLGSTMAHRASCKSQ